MRISNMPYSSNVLDCTPYSDPIWWESILSSVSLIIFCFTVIFFVVYHALYSVFNKTPSKYPPVYSDYP